MQSIQKKRMGPWTLVLTVLLSAVFAERIMRIIYSSFDSNIVYRDTVIPVLLSYGAEIVGVLFLSVALAAIVYMTKQQSPKNGAIMLLAALAVLTLLPLSGWAVDIATHNFYGYELELLKQAFLREETKPIPMILGLLIGLLARKTKKMNVSHIIVISSALYAIILLIPVVFRIVTFFMEYNYPTADEISAMIQDVVYPLFFYGILLGGGALLFVPLLDKIKERSK